MIKVLRIITRLNIGGPAIHAILLSSGLNNDGYKDILITGKESGSEGNMQYLAAANGVKPIMIPELGRELSLVNDFKTFLRLFEIIRKEKPDIVHTHMAKAGSLGRIAALFCGTPIKIHTFHGHIFDGYFSPVKAKVFLWIERFLALFTDRVIAVSESVKEEIVDKLKVAENKKCVVVPLGLDLKNFLECEKEKGSFRRELGLQDDVLLIGIVGRLVPIKNHEMFLNVAKQILGKNLSAKVMFVIVGDGERREDLKDYAKKLGLEGSLIFTGWRQSLSSVYSDLDIVALTSLNEGTPVSIIEAMASGKPVIATDVGGVKDLIVDGENGFLAKSNDVKDFTDRLTKLIADKEQRSRFGKRGREIVREKYVKERLVRDIKRLYEDCLRERSR